MTGRKLPLADRLRVRTPCDVGWEQMEERGRDRHCGRCDRLVHDVSQMTRREVETLLEARERGERVCLHLHVRRSDGAVLVADGHVERERASARRAPPSRVVAAAVATATAMTACSSTPSPPPEAPHVVIAVGTAPTAPTAPTPLSLSAPAPPPYESAPPPLESEMAPPMPDPTPPPPARATTARSRTKAAAPPKKKAPTKKQYEIISGDIRE